MKSKQLRALIYEAIMEVLTEDTNALVTTKGGTKAVSIKNPADLADLKSDSNVSGIETTSGQKIKEIDIKEMAGQKYELVDPDFDSSPYNDKSISGVSLGDVLEYIKENPGIEKKKIQTHFGFVRPQIANAIINTFLDTNLITKSGTTSIDPETGDTIIAEPTEEPEGPLSAEDFFVGNRMAQRRGSMFGSTPEPEITPTEEDELEIPEEPTIPELPINREPLPSGLSDEDYNAWTEYVKYKDRLVRTKSALIQIKKLSRGGDDLSSESTEIDRLRVKKAEYEQRMQDILASSKYVQDRLNKEPELNEAVLKRFRLLANIK
jgi:hypothetical protein